MFFFKLTPKLKLILSLLIVILGIPLLSNINILMPYSYNYCFKSDTKYFNDFWISVITIQIIALIVSIKLAKINNCTFHNFGQIFNTKQVFQIYCVAIFICAITIFALEILFKRGFNETGITAVTLDKKISYTISIVNAGICEEFVFRAFCFKLLTELKIPAILSILFSSIAFTVYHTFFLFFYFEQYFIFGILMGLLYVWKKNIIYCMFVHISYNLFVMFFNFF